MILDTLRVEYQCVDVGNTEYARRRKMREIIVASDLHIHSNVNQPHIIEFCDMVRKKRPQILVLVGDVASAWDDSWDNIRKTKEWLELLKLFEERYATTKLMNYYIKGDEDYAIKREYIPYCNLFDRSVSYNQLCFIHGWQFDVLWESIHGVAYWLAMNHPDWAIKIWKVLKKHWTKRTKYGASPDAEFRRKWWVHVAYMHYRATKFALENNTKLIIGHTHTPSSYGGWLYDVGSLSENKTYLEVNSNKEIVIREL